MQDNFVIAAEHADIISELTNEQAGIVFKALFEEMEIDDIAARIVYKTIKAQVDRYKEKYNKRSEAGKKGMEKRWGDNNGVSSDNKVITNDNKVITTNNNEYQTITPIPVPVPIPEPIKEISPKGDTKKRFKPPTLSEVQEYVIDQGYNIDASKFVDFYASKGWLVGKSPMKDWKAAVRNWSRSQRQEKTAEVKRQEVSTNRFNNFPQRTYEYEELERQLLAAQGVR